MNLGPYIIEMSLLMKFLEARFMSERRAKSEYLNKRAAMANYEEDSEINSTFPISLWGLNSATNWYSDVL